jgi:predicted house-cleaning noncanonical NTP pyrophosphatase (MazG superfamily)
MQNTLNLILEKIVEMDNKLNNKYQYSDHIASNRRLLGLWDEKLSETLERFIEDSREMFVLTDMDTNVNKDVEQLFIKRGVNY